MGIAVSLESGLNAAPVEEISRFVIPVTEPHMERWYAVCTCSRSEKCVARQLEQRGIEHFLPLYRSWRHWKDRRKQTELALFPGYVFVRMVVQQRLRVLQLSGVVRLVGANCCLCLWCNL